MHFRTQIPIPQSNFPIDYTSRIVSLGSCFAENIGDKFSYFKFQHTVNPFGIIFNPVSIEKIIQKTISGKRFSEADIFFHNDLWNCFDVHSELSSSDKETFLERLNATTETFRSQLEQATHFSLTLGTAWVYRNNDSGEIVANCHKVPQKQFTKELLSVAQIEESLQNIISLITSVNPNCKFIFTVSPVRHIKDGFVENQQSKSHLITALHTVLQKVQNPQNTVYFPSYEILMDELRDYRFYAEDMLHPNQVGIDYIWERFVQSMVADSCRSTMDQVDSIQKALLHRPFNPNSEQHKIFLEKLNQKISKLVVENPLIQF
ncbi:GSCFA family protein [Flavobacterium enshiense DK69]|uniref:GSCFA domain-containing protein n=1 Tax=Flavobacterium enshiense DK69 TaxID=1107311 RepID=V6SAZ3_9FLAO|nr:GSCFA domain-containing protein [Flavobacterium enshiense]ESU23412.1 GSCFA family protein [Flavobacterium enshiense DK69]KGO96362.1 GSCFA domain-containing protein [Flavobacterium enshiense DK69]